MHRNRLKASNLRMDAEKRNDEEALKVRFNWINVKIL